MVDWDTGSSCWTLGKLLVEHIVVIDDVCFNSSKKYSPYKTNESHNVVLLQKIYIKVTIGIH